MNNCRNPICRTIRGVDPGRGTCRSMDGTLMLISMFPSPQKFCLLCACVHMVLWYNAIHALSSSRSLTVPVLILSNWERERERERVRFWILFSILDRYSRKQIVRTIERQSYDRRITDIRLRPFANRASGSESPNFATGRGRWVPYTVFAETVHHNSYLRVPALLRRFFSTAAHVVRHSCSLGDGMSPAGSVKGASQCRACHQLWSSLLITCSTSPTPKPTPACTHGISSSSAGSYSNSARTKIYI